MKTLLVLGESRNGIYLLHSALSKFQSFFKHNLVSKSSFLASPCISVSSFVFESVTVPVNNTFDVKLWHIRLGHMPISAMKRINFILSSTLDCPCDVCPLARQSRFLFHSSYIKSTTIFELFIWIHGDPTSHLLMLVSSIFLPLLMTLAEVLGLIS